MMGKETNQTDWDDIETILFMCIIHSMGVFRRRDWQESRLDMEIRASLIAQLVKNSPAVQEIVFQFLGQEDPLEKG